MNTEKNPYWIFGQDPPHDFSGPPWNMADDEYIIGYMKEGDEKQPNILTEYLPIVDGVLVWAVLTNKHRVFVKTSVHPGRYNLGRQAVPSLGGQDYGTESHERLLK